MTRIAICLLIVAAASAAWSQDVDFTIQEDRGPTERAAPAASPETTEQNAAPQSSPPDEQPPRSEERWPLDHRDGREDWRPGPWHRRWPNDAGERRWPNPPDRQGWEDRSRDRRGPRFGGYSQHHMWDTGDLAGGFVFLHDEYLPPPYRLRVESQTLRLNGRPLAPVAANEPLPDVRAANPELEWFDLMRQQLQNGAVILIEPAATASPDVEAPAQHAVCILPRDKGGIAFLKQIAAGEASRTRANELPPAAVAFLARYDPPPDLVARAKEELKLIERSRSDDVFSDSSVDAWAYPLTALGMLLSAVAVGQLFVSRSLLSQQPIENSPDIARAAAGCIAVVAGLSLLDLVWTLLSLRAGIMHELNPLATQFLSSAWALTGFKIGVTLLGAMILYVLRHHRPAQLAAWWLCVVCTLLTVRWVAFTSLFVT